MKYFYAIKYAYGRNVINNGNRSDQVHRFTTVAERTKFINDWSSEHVDVDALKATSATIKRANRYTQQGWYDWPEN